MVSRSDNGGQAGYRADQTSSAETGSAPAADGHAPATSGAPYMQAATERLQPEPDLIASSQQPADSDPLDVQVASSQPCPSSGMADTQSLASPDAQSDIHSLQSSSSVAGGLPTLAPPSTMARVLSSGDRSGTPTDLSMAVEITAYVSSTDSESLRLDAERRNVWLCQELLLSLIDESFATHLQIRPSPRPLSSYFFTSEMDVMSDGECWILVKSKEKFPARRIRCAVVKNLGVQLILSSNKGDLQLTGSAKCAIGELVPEHIPKKAKAMDVFKRQIQCDFRMLDHALSLKWTLSSESQFKVGLLLHQPYDIITERALNKLRAENLARDFSPVVAKVPGQIQLGKNVMVNYAWALTMKPSAKWPFSGEVLICNKIPGYDMIVSCTGFEKSSITGLKHVGKGLFKMEPYRIYGKFGLPGFLNDEYEPSRMVQRN